MNRKRQDKGKLRDDGRLPDDNRFQKRGDQPTAGFRYTYSATDQEEIRTIRRKYMPREENPMERLRRLDRKVAGRARLWSVVTGVLGTLVLGAGMSLFMSNLGVFLGISGNALMPAGIGVGLAGMILVLSAYPVYQSVLRCERKKAASEILRLTDELMK